MLKVHPRRETQTVSDSILSRKLDRPIAGLVKEKKTLSGERNPSGNNRNCIWVSKKSSTRKFEKEKNSG